MKMMTVLEERLRSLPASVGKNLPDRPWDWQTVVLTIALVQIASSRLAVTEWVPSLEITRTISFYAVLLGLVLGYSSFSGKNAVWSILEYGVLLIPMQLLKTIERTDNDYEDLRNLLLRVGDSLVVFFKNQPVYDSLFFLLLTCIGFWLVGSFAGYRLTRHAKYLDVVLAPGLVMLMIQLYDPWVAARVWGLAVYLFVALALLGRMYYLNSRTDWHRQHVFLSSDTEWEFSRSVLITAAILVFVAWSLPGALNSIRPAAEAWRNFTEPVTDRLSDAVSALDSPYSTSVGGDFYGSELRLGSNAPLSDSIVFYVEVEDTQVDNRRFYWRGRAYDRYENGQWINSGFIRQNFDPERDEFTPPDSTGREEMNLTVTLNFPKQNLLYGPAEVTWVDRESRLVAKILPEDGREITAWLADTDMLAGDSYEVRALVSNPTVQDLREAGTSYPDWVTEGYLQVPQTIEPQLKELAEQITRASTSPYDKSQAITSFLRGEIQYETKITETPPQGIDPLMWVLLEHKRGFCVYYATAQVLMLRTLGIPARMAAGFAQGEYDPERDRYTITRVNAHAWPEVYFPGIGWVEFEPTGNQDPLNRPQSRAETAPENEAGQPSQNNPPGSADDGGRQLDEDPTLAEDENLLASRTVNPWARYLIPSILLGLLILGTVLGRYYSLTERLPVYLVERYSRSGGQPPRWLSDWEKWSGLRPIERTFQLINLCLNWLGQSPSASSTPAERARALAKMIPSAGDAIGELTQEYQTALFTPRPENLVKARRAGLMILYLTMRTRILNFQEYINRRYN